MRHCAWPDVEAFLTRSDMVVIPIGSTEQHGPTGLLGTDAMCPEGIALAASDQKPDDVLVAPTFAVGSAQHHMGFPGTITLRPETMVAAMNDWIDSFVRHGFRKIYWLNGHGGNVAPAQTAFANWWAKSSLAAVDPKTTLFFRNWWELPGVFSACKRLYGAAHGSHATPSEVAVTYALLPEAETRLKPLKKLNPEVAPNGPVRDAADFRRRFPDGRMGSDPTLATAADGRELIKLAAAGLITELGQFTDDALADAD